MSFVTNARIRSTMLGIEDHGIMTFFLNLEWSGAGQGFGGYCLDGKSGTVGHSKSIISIRRILEVVGVEKWEDLKGKLVRIRKDDEWGQIKAIGHIIDDRWFDIEQFWKEEQSPVQ